MANFSQEIEDGLKVLKRLDTNFEIFGSNSHQYKLNSTLCEKDILEFEKNNKCTLPEAYRHFLTNIGNGGAGPSYGVFPLGMMDDGFELSKWTQSFVQPHKDFPYKKAINEKSILTKGVPKESEFITTEQYEQAYDEWSDENFEELQNQYWENHTLYGAIPIAHHGCAYRSWLVVATGSEYGHIWQDDTPDENGIYPLTNKAINRYTFDSWYLEWIENSISALKTPPLY